MLRYSWRQGADDDKGTVSECNYEDNYDDDDDDDDDDDNIGYSEICFSKSCIDSHDKN